MFTLKSFAQYFRTYPLRGVLTVLTIAIGVGALIITFSLSFDVGHALERSISIEGRRIVIANGTLNADGNLAPQRPPRFSGAAPGTFELEYENLRDATRVAPARWTRATSGGTSYQVRSAIAADPQYAPLLDLTMVAGGFYTAEDGAARRPVVVISERTARIVFGGAEAAIGGQIGVAVPTVTTGGGAGGFGGGQRMTISQQAFSVVGVYRDVSELARVAYGVGDFIIPYEFSGITVGQFRIDAESVIMARLVQDSVDVARARLATIAELEYGDGAQVAVWEGSPAGVASMIEESRRSVSSFALTINVLGVVILVASSIGIFSIMLVEVLNRMREIGLRRALGATTASIRRFFLSQALYFSVLGSAFGTALAFLFYRMVGMSLAPFFETTGLSAADLDLATPGVLPIALAVGAAVVVGAVFGFFPAIAASRTPIVDCIREEAA